MGEAPQGPCSGTGSRRAPCGKLPQRPSEELRGGIAPWRGQASDPYVVEADRMFESARRRLRQLAEWPVIIGEVNWLDECMRCVERLLRAPAYSALFLGLTEDAAERERWRRAEEECRAAWASGAAGRAAEWASLQSFAGVAYGVELNRRLRRERAARLYLGGHSLGPDDWEILDDLCGDRPRSPRRGAASSAGGEPSSAS